MDNLEIKRFIDTKLSVVKVPRHEIAASVDEIVALVGVDKTYNYGYWLRKVKQSGMCFPEILGVLKEARDLPDKYNKGGFITNKLSGKKNAKTNLTRV